MFKDVKSLLPKTIKRVDISRQLDAVRLIKIFEKSVVSLLGSDFASNMKVLYINKKNVSLISFAPGIAEQIKRKEVDLLDVANKNAGGNYFEKIKILG